MADEHRSASEEMSSEQPETGALSAELADIREQIVPYIGERAVSLFAFALFDSAGGTQGATYFRDLLAASGTDVDAPQVTETEGLLIRWARASASNSGGDATAAIAPELQSQFDGAFSPKLHDLLVEFARLAVSSAIAQRR